MKNSYTLVNEILAKWNPLGVSEDLAMDEYISYVPRIVKLLEDRESLKNEIVRILVNELGCEFDKENNLHKESVDSLCDHLVAAKSQVK